MFWTFNLSLDSLATVWATFPNIGRIFVQFSGHSGQGKQCAATFNLIFLSLYLLRLS
jgi:hypothetical protein